MNNKMRGFPSQAKRPQQRIDADTLPPVVCTNCGWSVFIQANIIKRLDAIRSSDGKEKPVIIPVLLCTRCENMFRNDRMITIDEFEKLKEGAS